MTHDRQKELREVLEELGAIQIATHQLKDSERCSMGRLDVYFVTGRVIMVRIYEHMANGPLEASWDVFIPVSDAMEITTTLDALKAWATVAK